MTDEVEKTQENQGGMPLFFRNPVPLDSGKHAKAGIKSKQSLTFTRKTNSIPVNAIEFIEAAKHYPIVFTTDELALPAVIVGLEQENYFVDAKGNWKEAAYVPAYVRKYPFVFMEVPEKQQYLLCVDDEAELFTNKATDENLAFYKDGQPSDLTKQALEFCTAFHNHYLITRNFCKDLKEADLLTPNQSDAKLFNGRQIRLGGFQLIDEAKFNALPDDKILEFRKKGWLPFIYFALMSASNWKKVVDMAADIERGNQKAA